MLSSFNLKIRMTTFSFDFSLMTIPVRTFPLFYFDTTVVGTTKCFDPSLGHLQCCYHELSINIIFVLRVT